MKQFLLILISLSIIGQLQSQVLFSKIIANKVVIGPKNISNNQEILASSYLQDIESFKEDLQKEKTKQSEAIAKLTSQQKLSNKSQRKLNRAKNNTEQIELELKLAQLIAEDWQAISTMEASLPDLMRLINKGECVAFETEEGTFHSEQVELAASSFNKNFTYTQFIPIEQVLMKEETLKKKRRDCRSANPKDCEYWCVVKSVDNYTFKDMEGKEHKQEGCLKGFEFDLENNQLINKVIFNKKKSPISVMKLKHKENGEELVLLDWKMVDCE